MSFRRVSATVTACSSYCRRRGLSDDFKCVFNALSEEFDLEFVFVDGMVVLAQRKAAGKKGEPVVRGPAGPEEV